MQQNLVSASKIFLEDAFVTFPPISTASLIFGEKSDNNSEFPHARDVTSGEGDLKPRALVVDDMVDVTEMLSVFLGLAGYDVVTANSARAGIEQASAQHFDVVISDIGMPQMNGYELAENLRQMPEYATTPLVAVTGFSMYDDRERSLRSGFSAHLTKPIDPNVLFQLIERLRN